MYIYIYSPILSLQGLYLNNDFFFMYQFWLHDRMTLHVYVFTYTYNVANIGYKHAVRNPMTAVTADAVTADAAAAAVVERMRMIVDYYNNSPCFHTS